MLVAILGAAGLSCGGCNDTNNETVANTATQAVHLVDVLGDARMEGASPAAPVPAPLTAWKFNEAGADSATLGWEAGPGIAGLDVIDRRLTGTSTEDGFPVLHVERPYLDVPDYLHAVEVRMRASAGTDLWFGGSVEETIDLPVFRDWWRTQEPITTPIVPGDDFRTYLLVPPIRFESRMLRHVVIRPTNAPDASFEIESVRLIWYREHLNEIPEGLSWQGLGGVYRETIVARSPQTLHFDITLPDRPRLDVSLGMVTLDPVRFSLSLTPRGTASGALGSARELLHERTLSMAGYWEDVTIDLAAWAGQPVTLSLGLESDEPSQIGLWGSPVVRSAHPVDITDRPQGVILVMCDTLRTDHLDLFGYDRETAPNLTRMAAEGVSFNDCFSQATWTKASSASLLTSLYPTTHGVADFGQRLPAGATTLAECFRDAGFATLSMSSILFTGKFSNLHQGFEVVHEASSLPPVRGSKTAQPYVARLTPWLENHRDEPFFVFLHMFDPHDPYLPKPPYDTRWAEREEAEAHFQRMASVRPHIEHPVMKRLGLATIAELEAAGVDASTYVGHMQDWYDGSIRAMDVELARLFETLQNLGLDERTLVVFTSDHGEEFLDHGRMFHGQGVYQELSHVPLVLRWPGRIPGGKTIGEVVQSIDVMPTVLELAGLEAPERVQGQSLVPLWTRDDTGLGTTWERRPAVTVKAATERDVPPPQTTEVYALTTDEWKLVHHVRRQSPDEPEFELFDRHTDPRDLVDVASQHPNIVVQLARQLDVWRRMTLEAKLPDDAETASLDNDELERLRALGYLK